MKPPRASLTVSLRPFVPASIIVTVTPGITAPPPSRTSKDDAGRRLRGDRMSGEAAREHERRQDSKGPRVQLGSGVPRHGNSLLCAKDARQCRCFHGDATTTCRAGDGDVTSAGS